jgi:hypothetical protein
MRRAEDDSVDVAALDNAQAALDEVHDWVVDAFVVVDHFVCVDTCDDVCGAVVFPMVVFALGFGFGIEPAALFAKFGLEFGDGLQECDVPAAEEVEAAVYVDNSLSWARSVARDHGSERSFAVVVV